MSHCFKSLCFYSPRYNAKTAFSNLSTLESIFLDKNTISVWMEGQFNIFKQKRIIVDKAYDAFETYWTTYKTKTLLNWPK